MPTDKIKSPDLFPPEFEHPFLGGLVNCRLLTSKEKQPCLAMARKYRAFVRSIAAFPMHRFNGYFKFNTYRTRIKQDSAGKWVLMVVVNKKVDILGAWEIDIQKKV